MAVADRATTLSLISSAVISLCYFLERGWLASLPVGGGIVTAQSQSSIVRPSVRLSVCLRVLLCVSVSPSPQDRLLTCTCLTYVDAPTSGATLMNY